MATIPYLAISPSAVLSIAGLIHGPDKTKPTPAEDWRKAVVDVIIPVHNEQEKIILCLSSLTKQTLKPRRILLVDDASTDNTVALAKEFSEIIGLKLEITHRKNARGKTPTLKYEAQNSDADVEFILDGDSALESHNYIERLVEELYQGAGIACACGLILPFTEKDWQKISKHKEVKAFQKKFPETDYRAITSWYHRIGRGITNTYREMLYIFLQKFIYHGEMVFFGTIINPIGCAVAYRRKYLKDLFDKYDKMLGEDLTTSEDIFIGFCFADAGYRNIQLNDVSAKTIEPVILNLPRQIFKWSSAFLQSCFYFNSLVCTPFKSINLIIKKHQDKRNKELQKLKEKRKIKEAYRQSFGPEYTKKYGRPIGWYIFTAAFEKISFPTILIILMLSGWWLILAITFIAETILCCSVNMIISPGERLRVFFKTFLTSPIRYFFLFYDVLVIAKFATDLWITGKRNWRK